MNDRPDRPTRYEATARIYLETTRPEPGLVCLRISGELDALTAPRLAQTLRAELAAGPPLVVALDLSAVVFCAAAGLTVLLEARHAAATAGRVVTLDRLARQVRRAIHVAGLGRQLGASHRDRSPLH